jgi:hypothetical protein
VSDGFQSSRAEANRAYIEELERRINETVRRGPNDQACELCWSDMSDYACDICGKYTCSSCTERFKEGTFCLKHKPVETEAEAA